MAKPQARGERGEAAVVGAIYDAALAPERWPAVLDALRDRLRVKSAIFFCEDVVARRASFFFENLGLTRQILEEYSTHYVFQEAGFCYRRDKPVGTVSANNLLVPDREHERSALYQDCFRPAGFFYSAGALVARDGGRYATVGLQRTRRMGSFTQDDLRSLARLVPHLGRALQISRLFAQDAGMRIAAEGLLERLSQAIVLLDGAGRIVFGNGPAMALLAAADGLSAASNGLLAATPPGDARLQALIRGATATAEGRAGGAGGALRLRRPSGGPPYRVLVLPLPSRNALPDLAQAGARAAVVIQDDHAANGLDRPLLAALFGFTPAEAALVSGMAQGLSPEEYAERNAKALNTVRTQLRSIYDKLGIHRQTQMLKLVLTSPAVLAADPERPTGT